MQIFGEKIWAAAQEKLRSMLNADTYNLWFASLRAGQLDGSCLTLEVADDFCEVWLKDNYQTLLQEVLALVSGKQLQVSFKVAANATPTVSHAINHRSPAPKAKVSEASAEKAATGNEPSFNPKNTFDSFVVGNNNNFAYAAALAVAQAPGKSYNPLFLYGG
ncbi:MAG TPA: DnaA/Hda family protein, partial [Verrucomicrobiae bacterium]|nr:DnaA/Hda family protein [Verrucomicrobiae bacterium]